jgi:hypothetical protein
MEERRGTGKGIPGLVIAGSSADDIVMIVFYTVFLSIESGGSRFVDQFLEYSFVDPQRYRSGYWLRLFVLASFPEGSHAGFPETRDPFRGGLWA